MIRTVPWGVKLLVSASVAAVVVPAVIIMGRSPEANPNLPNQDSPTMHLGLSGAPNKTFSKGTIKLTNHPKRTLVSFVNMLPGDTVTNPLALSNEGTQPLRYSLSSTATNPDRLRLKDQLVLTVRTIDVTSPRIPCNNFDGARLYTGDLDSVTGRIIGNPAPGQHGRSEGGGDRLIAARSSETLCFRVSLPRETGNAFQAAATVATFTVDAEQIPSRSR